MPPTSSAVVVAIDPAVSYNDDADETGIVVAGRGVDGNWYVLADRSCRLSPDGWARRAVRAHREFAADRIIGEVNNGGELVESVLRTVDASIPYKAVRASRGKLVRAEPIAALYEQGKVFHVGPGLEDLEDQLCTWTPESGASPDRLDALVWGPHGAQTTGPKSASGYEEGVQGAQPPPGVQGVSPVSKNVGGVGRWDNGARQAIPPAAEGRKPQQNPRPPSRVQGAQPPPGVQGESPCFQ